MAIPVEKESIVLRIVRVGAGEFRTLGGSGLDGYRMENGLELLKIGEGALVVQLDDTLNTHINCGDKVVGLKKIIGKTGDPYHTVSEVKECLLKIYSEIGDTIDNEIGKEEIVEHGFIRQSHTDVFENAIKTYVYLYLVDSGIILTKPRPVKEEAKEWGGYKKPHDNIRHRHIQTDEDFMFRNEIPTFHRMPIVGDPGRDFGVMERRQNITGTSPAEFPPKEIFVGSNPHNNMYARQTPESLLAVLTSDIKISPSIDKYIRSLRDELSEFISSARKKKINALTRLIKDQLENGYEVTLIQGHMHLTVKSHNDTLVVFHSVYNPVDSIGTPLELMDVATITDIVAKKKLV